MRCWSHLVSGGCSLYVYSPAARRIKANISFWCNCSIVLVMLNVGHRTKWRFYRIIVVVYMREMSSFTYSNRAPFIFSWMPRAAVSFGSLYCVCVWWESMQIGGILFENYAFLMLAVRRWHVPCAVAYVIGNENMSVVNFDKGNWE